MVDTGKISGEKLAGLFKELIANRTIISVQAVETGFEQLTTIIGTFTEQKSNYLLVDKPRGFRESAIRSPWHLRFNFNGPDKLEYIFETMGGTNAGSELKIPFPDYVERLQRRRDFRINTPVGSRLMFAAGDIRGVMKLINVSVGGAYGVVFKHNAKDVKGPILEKNQEISNLAITFPEDKDMNKQLILIKRAEVRRIEHDLERKMYRYAFEFMEVEKEEKKKLVQSIYHLQRQYLQRR